METQCHRGVNALQRQVQRWPLQGRGVRGGWPCLSLRAMRDLSLGEAKAQGQVAVCLRWADCAGTSQWGPWEGCAERKPISLRACPPSCALQVSMPGRGWLPVLPHVRRTAPSQGSLGPARASGMGGSAYSCHVWARGASGWCSLSAAGQVSDAPDGLGDGRGPLYPCTAPVTGLPFQHCSRTPSPAFSLTQGQRGIYLCRELE